MIALAMLLQALRIAVPYLLAAAGGVLSERVGVIALGLEGMMLAGAFGAVLGAHATGSPWAALPAAVGAAWVVTGVLAVATLRYRANHVVVGVALNLLVAAATRFFLRLIFDSASNSPRVAGFGEDGGTALLAGTANPLLWLGVVVLPLLGWALGATRFGLRVRAVGEKPEAAASLGVPVGRIRVQGLLLGGALAGLGGAFLALEQHQFSNSMTAGRGFIALAAVYFAAGRPGLSMLACLLFGLFEALQFRLQLNNSTPPQFFQMLPYLMVVIMLVAISVRKEWRKGWS
jgi:simple sugar transport system permease protein